MRGKKTETEGGLSRALNPSYSQTESPVGRQRFSDLSIAVEKKKVPVDREGYEHGPGVKKKKKKKTEPCIFLKKHWVKKKNQPRHPDGSCKTGVGTEDIT